MKKSRITPGSAFDLKGYVSQIDWSSFGKKKNNVGQVGLFAIEKGRGTIYGLNIKMSRSILKPSQV